MTLVDTYVQVCGWVCVYLHCIVLFKSPTDSSVYVMVEGKRVHLKKISVDSVFVEV